METAPFFAEIADAPEGGRAHWLVAEDGVRIRIGHWVPADAAGTVLLFPGRTEYIEKYGRAARDFATRGFAMAAVDWRGQGLADRLAGDVLSGHVDFFGDYQRDVRAVMAAAEMEIPRSRSWLIQSVVALPSSTSPIRCTRPL